VLKILSITAPIFIIIGVGFVAVRTEFFSKPDIRALGRFVVNFALPALLLKTFSQRSFSEVIHLGYLAAYALGSLGVMSLAFCAAYFWKKRPIEVAALYSMGVGCSNSGYFGYPIVLQMLGAQAAVALALTMIVENVLLLPLTLAVADSGADSGAKFSIALAKSFARLIRNPIIIAILIGAGCAIFEIRPPPPLANAIDVFAMASAPVALFVLGGTLVGLDIRGMLGDVALITTGKLLLHPLAVFAAVMLFPSIEPNLKLAAVTFASVPMLSIYPIFGQKYGHEGICASAMITSTLAAFVSISLILGLLRMSGVFSGIG